MEHLPHDLGGQPWLTQPRPIALGTQTVFPAGFPLLPGIHSLEQLLQEALGSPRHRQNWPQLRSWALRLLFPPFLA